MKTAKSRMISSCESVLLFVANCVSQLRFDDLTFLFLRWSWFFEQLTKATPQIRLQFLKVNLIHWYKSLDNHEWAPTLRYSSASQEPIRGSIINSKKL